MSAISLTTRQCSVLRMLLKADKAVSTTDIADQLEITKRKVRYDLVLIENWLERRNAAIEKKPGQGFQVLADKESKAVLLRELQQYPASQIILSHNERQEFLLFLLLTSIEPIVLKQLQLMLGVSRTTILQDLDKTEAWLGLHGLFLTRKPSFGFQVEGKVMSRCDALITFLLDVVGVMPILALCVGSRKTFQTQMHNRPILSDVILAFFSKLEIEYCASLVTFTQRAMGLKFTDNSYVSIIFHIAMQIQRIQKGGVKAEELGAKDERELDAARQIARRIEERYNIVYSNAEKAYLAAQLYAARLSRSIKDIRGEIDRTAFSSETVELVGKVLEIAAEYLHPYLQIDRELERSLIFHLGPVLERLRLEMPIRNPLLEDVKECYNYVFEVARHAGEILSAHVGKPVPEDEIGYLAMHFGAAMERLRPFPGTRKRVVVVCGEGVATAWLLVSRLRAELPNIDVVEVMSAHEVQRQQNFEIDIDAIISILPLERKDMPVIVVSPLLHVEDVRLLRQNLGISVPVTLDDEIEYASASSKSLAALLKDETIALNVEIEDWKNAVDFAVGLLVRTESVESSYAQAIKNLIVKNGTYMVVWPGAALLHGPPKAGVKQLCMSLVTLKNPIPFGQGEYDEVDVIFTLGALEGFGHRQALEELNELMNDQTAVNAIRKANTQEQIIRTILRTIRQPIKKN